MTRVEYTGPSPHQPPNGRMSRPTLDAEIARLESRLADVVDVCRRLRLENRSLRVHQTRLIEERARLVEKNETARTKVEQMIVRLKSLEAGQ